MQKVTSRNSSSRMSQWQASCIRVEVVPAPNRSTPSAWMSHTWVEKVRSLSVFELLWTQNDSKPTSNFFASLCLPNSLGWDGVGWRRGGGLGVGCGGG